MWVCMFIVWKPSAGLRRHRHTQGRNPICNLLRDMPPKDPGGFLVPLGGTDPIFLSACSNGFYRNTRVVIPGRQACCGCWHYCLVLATGRFHNNQKTGFSGAFNGLPQSPRKMLSSEQSRITSWRIFTVLFWNTPLASSKKNSSKSQNN